MNTSLRNHMKKSVFIGGVLIACVFGAFWPKQQDNAEQVTTTPRAESTIETVVTATGTPQLKVAEDFDPKAAERAQMLASLGFGTNGGHDVKVNFTVSR